MKEKIFSPDYWKDFGVSEHFTQNMNVIKSRPSLMINYDIIFDISRPYSPPDMTSATDVAGVTCLWHAPQKDSGVCDGQTSGKLRNTLVSPFICCLAWGAKMLDIFGCPSFEAMHVKLRAHLPRQMDLDISNNHIYQSGFFLMRAKFFGDIPHYTSNKCEQWNLILPRLVDERLGKTHRSFTFHCRVLLWCWLCPW